MAVVRAHIKKSALCDCTWCCILSYIIIFCSVRFYPTVLYLRHHFISYHIVSCHSISYRIILYHISLILQFFLFDGWDPSICPLPATLEEDSQSPEIDKLIPTEINQNPSSLLSTSISLLFDRTLYKQAIRSRIHLPKREELLFLTLGIGTTQASMLPSLYILVLDFFGTNQDPSSHGIAKGFQDWIRLNDFVLPAAARETKGWFELYTYTHHMSNSCKRNHCKCLVQSISSFRPECWVWLDQPPSICFCVSRACLCNHCAW